MQKEIIQRVAFSKINPNANALLQVNIGFSLSKYWLVSQNKNKESNNYKKDQC